MNTKLQLALDDISMEQATTLLSQVRGMIDIIEVGTPFLMEYGISCIRTFKKQFPELEVLCDAKIMDAGGYEATLAFQAGADYVTVLGVTNDLTIQDVVSAARKAHCKVMVDMICVSNFETRIQTLEKLGVDILAVHTGVDQQAVGRTPLDDLKEMKSHVTCTTLAVAGGINNDTLGDYLSYQPEIIIVGGGIVHSSNPVDVCAKLSQKIRVHNSYKGGTAMSVKANTVNIISELVENLQYVEDSQFHPLLPLILNANHIFTAGAGRSGVAIRAFSNRLMHLGFSVNVVGEISAPHTQDNDLLIIGSGSGETESLIAMAKKAKKNGVKLALFTMDSTSTIAQLADTVLILPGVSPKLQTAETTITSIQPMGSAFEQLLFLTFDGIILELMEIMHETSETMFERHANLE